MIIFLALSVDFFGRISIFSLYCRIVRLLHTGSPLWPVANQGLSLSSSYPNVDLNFFLVTRLKIYSIIWQFYPAGSLQ